MSFDKQNLQPKSTILTPYLRFAESFLNNKGFTWFSHPICVSFTFHEDFRREWVKVFFFGHTLFHSAMIATLDYILNHQLISNEVHRYNLDKHSLHIFFGSQHPNTFTLGMEELEQNLGNFYSRNKIRLFHLIHKTNKDKTKNTNHQFSEMWKFSFYAVLRK